MHKLKLAIITLAVSLSSGLGFAAQPAYAAVTPKEDACEALEQINGKGCAEGETRVSGLVQSIVQILSIVVGIAAVIMIIVSGLKYVTASGDPSNITSAKNTLLYALIGLFVAAIAQVLVRFAVDTGN